MNIFDQLGIPEENIHWHDLAACKDIVATINSGDGPLVDPMFDSYENDKGEFPIRTAVDEMCLSCPVQQICYDYGVDNEQPGVWGGIYLNNGKHDRVRNSHKTKETWRRIKSKIDIHGR